MAAATRVGDVIDDYCTRCKAVMNHSVISVVDAAPVRTECRTCYSAHKYRNAKGRRVRPASKSDLFDEVLQRMGPIGRR